MTEDQERKSVASNLAASYAEKRRQRMANIKTRVLTTGMIIRLQQALKLLPENETLAPSREYQQVVGDITVENPGETLNQDPPAPAA